MPLFPHRHRRDRDRRVPDEHFANDANWPEPRNDPKEGEHSHGRIPEQLKGPFSELFRERRGNRDA